MSCDHGVSQLFSGHGTLTEVCDIISSNSSSTNNYHLIHSSSSFFLCSSNFKLNIFNVSILIKNNITKLKIFLQEIKKKVETSHNKIGTKYTYKKITKKLKT
jgi:hypothetical protein